MSKSTTIWIVIAAGMIVLGSILFAGGMAVNRWDFTRLNTVQCQTTTHPIDEVFTNISLHTDTADILFAPADDGICRVMCYERVHAAYTAAVKDGTLTVTMKDTRKWYEHIGVFFDSPKITVYLPKNEYAALTVSENTGHVEIPSGFTFDRMEITTSTGGVQCGASVEENMTIRTTTGDIEISNVSAGEIDCTATTGNITANSITCTEEMTLRVSTGKTALTDIHCDALASHGTTGDITLKNVLALGRLSVERGTGSVQFDRSDAAEIFVKTSTGSVQGSLLSGKVFITDSHTGRIRVPASGSGGRCEISTGTGDITIDIA